MAKFCIDCGAFIPEGSNFCADCGTPVPPSDGVASTAPENTIPTAPSPPPQAPPAPEPPVYRQPHAASVHTEAKPSGKYAPIGFLGFIGIFLLMCIPIVNLILLVVWACGGCKKVVQRNYARAMLVVMAAALILFYMLGSSIIMNIQRTFSDAIISSSERGSTTGEEKTVDLFKGLLDGLAGTDENSVLDSLRGLQSGDSVQKALAGILEQYGGQEDDLQALQEILTHWSGTAWACPALCRTTPMAA